MLLAALLNAGLAIAYFIAFIWILQTLARLRRDQLAIFSELDRISAAVGAPPRRQLVIACPHCGSRYSPELTGCPHCGRAKPANAQPESVVVRGGPDAT